MERKLKAVLQDTACQHYPLPAMAHPTTSNAADQNERREGPLSLSRLREAFASMLGDGAKGQTAPLVKKQSASDHAPLTGRVTGASTATLSNTPCEISPRSVAEAMLFVGRPDNCPLSPRELAAAMRGVSPNEINDIVGELNTTYEADGSPYCIEQTGGGYRLILRPEFERMRDKFYGKEKEARLSPAVIEVLAILAYNQPATADEVNALRGALCGAALATLVRRQLVSLERPPDGGPARYSTTSRFLQLFRLENLAQLPRSEDLERV